MFYQSTRTNNLPRVSAAAAIKNGLAPDGGLYMPQSIPALPETEIRDLIPLSYARRAAFILHKFLTDYTEKELLEDCLLAYGEDRFPGGAAPLRNFDENIYALELWHGPTCAFKDMALQVMPRLLSRALAKTGEKRQALILVATSGDTGKAALEGYRDVPQVKIQVFYPEDGVSTVQKLQMRTQVGNNVQVTAIRGNFDDAQSGVKRIFADREMAGFLNGENVFLSSANSINWGRLAPQIAYYVSAYCDLLQAGALRMGAEMDVCVPTGNFGNIFAAYIARCMGLPIGRLICASNQNDVLTDFFASGTYNRNRPFHTTMSPSMDILISSNLERLLYLTAGCEKTADYMQQLREKGKYTVDEDVMLKIRSVFTGYETDEQATAAAIREAYEKHGYLCDTHTAVAYSAALRYRRESGADHPLVVVSTASPFKFAADVYCSLTDKRAESDLAALDALTAFTGAPIPNPLYALDKRQVHFSQVIDPNEMPQAVKAFSKE